jgi:hypothetical protein
MAGSQRRTSLVLSPGLASSVVLGRSRVLASSSRRTCPVTIPVSASYGTPQVSLPGASCRLDGPTTNSRCQSRSLRSKRTDTPTTNHDGVDFHSDCIPLPRRPRRSALRESGKHGGVDPNFPAYSGRTQRHPIRFYAFTQVTGLRPKARGIAKTAPFRYPH